MLMIQPRPRSPEKHLRQEKRKTKKSFPGDTYDLTFMSLFPSALVYFLLFCSNTNNFPLVKSISSAGTTLSLQSKAASKKY